MLMAGAVRTQMKRFGRYRCLSCSARHSPAALDAEIVSEYLSGKNPEALATQYHISVSAVLNRVHQAGATVRVVRYAWDARAFASIQTVDQAYWFGFLSADGSIKFRRQHQVAGFECNLQVGDISHLEKLRQFLQTTQPIRIVTNVHKKRERTYEHAQLRCANVQMASDLVQCGILGIKVGDPSPLHGMPEDLFRAYFRGYFDGDGHIGKHGKNQWWCHNICGPHQLVLSYLYSRCPAVTRHNAYRTSSIWKVQFGGTQIVSRICEWMYADSGPFLTRKRLLADQCRAQALAD